MTKKIRLYQPFGDLGCQRPEYGVAMMKGRTTWQRAEDLINIAHPQFRDQLIAEAEKMHIWRRSNKR